MLRVRLGLHVSVVSLSLLVTACGNGNRPHSPGQKEARHFDRAAAVTRLEARLAEDEAWRRRYEPLSRRKKAGEDVDAEIRALDASRPTFQDLEEIAERIVTDDPVDDAAFEAIEVILRGNRVEDISRWKGSPNEARQARMVRVLLDHHLHR